MSAMSAHDRDKVLALLKSLGAPCETKGKSVDHAWRKCRHCLAQQEADHEDIRVLLRQFVLEAETALRACADPPKEAREEQDLSAILQSVLQMIGLPGFNAAWFDAHGDWDFGKLRAHGLDAKLAEIRAALRACAEAPATLSAEQQMRIAEIRATVDEDIPLASLDSSDAAIVELLHIIDVLRAEARAPQSSKVQETEEDTRSHTPEIRPRLQSSAPTAGGITTPAPNYPLCKCGHPVRDHIAARTCWPSEHFECGCQMYEPAEALAPPAPGWQPIATAPKDGTEVLLTDGHWKRTGYWARRVNVWSVDCVAPLPLPTHWQPLPPPPRADARDRKD